VVLNYRGQETYKTVPGAIISILVFLITLSYGVQKAQAFVGRNNPEI